MNRTDKILQRNSERAAANAIARNVLCDELCKELGIDPLLPPLPITIEIPSLPPRASAMPTDWVRTSLFVNLAQNKVQLLKNQILESFGDIKIEFTGEQLNMFDNDVYLEVVRLAQNRAPGEQILFTRHSFLRNLGLTGGVNNYKALKASLLKLKSNTIKIANHKAGKAFSLIDELSWDESVGYGLSIGSVVMEIFSKTALSYIDLEARLKLKHPLSKYLQNYMSGGAPGIQKVKATTLMSLSATSGSLKDFLGKDRGLQKALDELKKAGLISSYLIEKNVTGDTIISWDRRPHRHSKFNAATT
ncbi:MAG: replication initiator protein A [Pseudomonadaceae bacterium]|nr:replication initiator protein A [Pseudomonadaceae bacterium]